ncbi:MAG: NUDIX hydrolase [Nitrospinales bacterium]
MKKINSLVERIGNTYPLFHEPELVASPRMAAVLVMLFPVDDAIHIFLIKRSEKLRYHPGEISFPGGVYEKEDGTLLATSLRETQEEVNMAIVESDVFSRLPNVETLTGFTVTPFVAMLDTLPPYDRSPDEVHAVLEAPLEPLLSTQQRDTRHEASMDMVIFQHGPHMIWGATARILKQIKMIC